MALKVPDPQQAVACLRAIKNVITSDGPMVDTQRSMMELAQRYFLHTREDIDALQPISADELAREVGDAELRRQLVQVMCAYVMLGKDIQSPHIAAIQRYARAFGVDEPAVDHLRYIMEDRLRLLRFDFRRRAAVGDALKQAYHDGGVRSVFDTVMQLAGHGADASVAERFYALEKLPPDTLGATLYRFYRQNRFKFPGEEQGTPLPLLPHDLVHVLSGYGTDVSGEIRTLSFQSGFKRDKPLMFFFLLLYQVHLGIDMVKLAPSAGAIKNLFDDPTLLEEAWKAYQRGAAMNKDLMDGKWDFWADFERPLDEVRTRYAVPAPG